MRRIDNYINGQYVPPLSNEYISSVNPATGEAYAEVADSDRRDVVLAVKAAKRAFPEWSATSPAERAGYLNKIAEIIRERLDDFALAESVDNGKTLQRAKTIEIPRAAMNFEFFASGIRHFASEMHDMPGSAINYTLRRPIGVAGCISPWNLPLYLFTWKIAPALAAGNCVVAKPSEVTPMTASLLGEVSREAGIPSGVLNIVHGYGNKVGAAITGHKDIPVISFTGGTQTGKEIAAKAAPEFKKVSLELGGKNPTIIFADCDYEKTLDGALQAAFNNQGQICLCGSRIFIEASLYERFKKDFVERAKALRVGDPLNEETEQGAIVSEAHFNKVMSHIQLSREEGGTILCGGEAVKPEGRCSNGWFISPTVVEGLSYDCRTNQEEIFGPVVTLTPFENDDEALKFVNSTQYGLCASIWTENIRRAHHMAERIDAGIIWVNCWLLRDLRTPFGGMKSSGVGREGGWEALRFYTEQKNVCIKL
ncbi:MAG: aldehyde dehydrogenase [Calditrichota bacterium]